MHFRFATMLVLCCCVFTETQAQYGALEPIKSNLIRYSERAVQEKIFVHVDRPLYLVGETLWFKAYQRDGASHQALDMSKVGYLELLDREKTPLLQTKFALKNGEGDGSVVLPSSIGSGVYTLRCYTNWMKNFDPGFFFESTITIVNPFVAFDPNPDARILPEYDLQFFPEGGHLVAGLPSIIGFRTVGTDGRGIPFAGQILNQERSVVATFLPDHHGIGRFQFTPEAGQRYSATIKDAQGQTHTFTFPDVQPEGVVMQLSDLGDVLAVKVLIHANTRMEKLQLISHTRQGKVQMQSAIVKGSELQFKIDKKSLAEGISHLTVFDGQWKPLCERLFFQYPSETLKIDAKVGRPSYQQREKIGLDIGATRNGTPVDQTSLSVAIYLTDSIQAQQPVSFDTYLLLTSDLKGQVEDADYYFHPKIAEDKSQIDLLMLTHGWRRFDWAQVLAGAETPFHFLPEYDGHFIEGKLVNKSTGSFVPSRDLFLAAPDYPVRLYTSISDRRGRVRFEVKEFLGPKELTIQTNVQEDSTSQFELTNPFVSVFSSKLLPKFEFDKGWENTLLNRAINMQARNAYLPEKYKVVSVEIPDSLAFFGKPDELYMLDAYTRFPTMEEVLREYVRGVLVRRKQKEFHFKMVDALVPNTVYDTDPMVLLDGIPIFNNEKIMAFDPLKVKKIELMNAKYFLGPMAFTGILSLSTYQHDLSGFELDNNVQIIPYEGLQLRREFYSPLYDSPAALASRVPDLRNLLFWAPSLTTDASGHATASLFSSDQPGRYQVVVQGITPEGNAATQSFFFEVKKRAL
ncbi:hypothetical protein [Dyadobacter tibetensis]|uniref:hypothetical protein n=1 Tax=Dyadobacter tibetensis TaxID=1211851 RepID=UPI0004B5DF84|nr:hypothetical protein [Dyadobacter tibetensis]